jgi:DNA-binding NarL/FixJ family response regulator
VGQDAHKPRLLLADHGPTRLGVRMALGDSIQICAEAGDAKAAIAAALRTQPDICIVGLEIPGGVVAAVEGIGEVAPDASVIVLAASLDFDAVRACLRAGAVGYLPGSIEPEPLRRAVASAGAGEAAIPRSMVLGLVRELQHRGVVEGHGLTVREAQVLSLLRGGASTATIAESLQISRVTVRRHISILMHRLGAENRAELKNVDTP